MGLWGLGKVDAIIVHNALWSDQVTGVIVDAKVSGTIPMVKYTWSIHENELWGVSSACSVVWSYSSCSLGLHDEDTGDLSRKGKIT